ncbi:carboxypeptidase regulatory-like domain-containing protein [Streptomyces sp. NBC_01589]|uniref:carboxypeptidase regulatory-like domain-containing protein n=1 Tax=unclassified Streptomyces TaxID=2593676 RepID=UPI00386E3FB4
MTAGVSLTADPDAATAVGYTQQVTDHTELFDSTSTDDGATWENVWAGPKVGGGEQKLTVRVPLRKYAGESSVKLRFHFVANWGCYWAIDDVNVQARTMLPVAGGLAVGTVRDAGTGKGVVGATVADASATDTGALTATTLDDPAVGDGFYTLFLADPGRHTLTVGASGYDTVTRKVVARADRAITENVRLKADG